MKKILNIGCGDKPIKGAINLDWIKQKGVDVVHNIEKTPWPFKKNEFDEVYAYNILEHVDNFMPIMEEIHRILKPNGLLIVSGPYYMHKDTFTDPTHRRGFTTKSFQYFEKECNLNFYTKARFRVEKISLFENDKSLYKFVPFKKYLGYLLWNLIQGIEFKLRAIK
ncbi:class I SAM-dependent methyltransferase [Candidatus Pacearchaeota archaeon]|nr:class I SAM-dependent methyltransferase [Candidatus Pacearchaeota archaeon]